MTEPAIASRLPRAGAVFLADAAALGFWRPDGSTLAAGLRHPQAWVDRVGADAAAAQLAGVALWVAAGWLGLGLLAVLVAGLPGRAGYRAGRLAQRLLPGVLRRLVAGSVGLSVALAPAAAQAGAPSSSGPSAAAPATVAAAGAHGLSRPAGTTAGTRFGGGDRAAARRGAGSPASVGVPVPWPTTPPVPGPLPHDDTVLVRPDDSLWLIAGRRLGPAADPARIAADWPAWYRANAALIGPDPDLIHPGQHLRVPGPPAATPKGTPR